MADFLFSVGADADAANQAVDEFVRRTRAALDSIEKVNLSSQGGIKNQQAMLDLAQRRLAVEEQIAAAGSRGGGRGSFGGGGGGGLTDITGVANANAGAVKKQADALDMLNRITGNAIFKFVEYELVMKAFNGAVGEVFNSLNEASNVQMEQTLQHIYNAQIDVNVALKDAIIIAKQWGSDITDVQQVIGLWTKQTSQMRDATGHLVDSQTALAAAAKLAADAEKFHAATGIDSLEVYRMTVSTWHQLGLTLADIPKLYDEIAYAATKISPVLKNMGGTGSTQEGAKDIFEGLANSAAALKSQGLGMEGVMAVIAMQIETMGANGKEAGRNISAMFGSLNQGGTALREWKDVLGGDGAFKNQDTFIASAVKHLNELKAAKDSGALKVSKNQNETWDAFINTLTQIKALMQNIEEHSHGTLNVIADAQMETYQGQVKRLSAAFQELNLAIGIQLLPTATHFIAFLSGTLMPALAAHAGQLAQVATFALQLGAAYLVLLGVNRVKAAVDAFTGSLTTQMTVENSAAASSRALAGAYLVEGDAARAMAANELTTTEAMDTASAAMAREKAALALLAEQMAIVQWQTGELAAKCDALGITETQLAEITATRVPTAFAIAGNAIVGFGAKVMATLGPLLKVYGVITAVTGGMEAFDARSNLGNVVSTELLQKEGEGEKLKGALNFGSDVQNVVSSLFGKDQQAGQFFQNRLRDDPNVRAAYADFNNHVNDKDKDRANQARERIVELLQADFDKKNLSTVPGYNDIDKISAAMKKAMESASGGTPSGIGDPGPGKSGSGGKQATQQQIAAEDVNKTKADAMAQISKYRDEASAAAETIKSLKEQGKESGYTADMYNQLAEAYTKQINAVKGGEGAAQKEITDLEARKKSLAALIATHGAHIDAQGKVTGGDKSAAVYAEAKAWRMADEAATKASGAVIKYQANIDALGASQNRDLLAASGESYFATLMAATTRQDGKSASTGMSVAGVRFNTPANSNQSYGGITDQAAEMAQTTSQSKTLLGIITTAKDDLPELQTALKLLAQTYNQTGDPAALAAGEKVGKAIQTITTSATEAAKKVADMNKELTGTFNTLALKNDTDISSLLGLDKGSVDAQKNLIEGYQQIDDEVTKINQLIKEYGGSYQNLDAYQKIQVDGITKQIQLQQQLLPLLAQQQQIQSSISYQAVQSALQKQGELVLDQSITRLMGGLGTNTASARKQQYDAAINGTAMSGIQSIFKDYLSTVVKDWWSKTVKGLTDQMFGDPATKERAALKALYDQNFHDLQTVAQQNAQAATTMLEASQNNLQAAGKSGAQDGGTAPNGWANDAGQSGAGSAGGWGAAAGAAGASAAAQAVQQGVTAAIGSDVKQTAESTKSSATSAQNAVDTVTNAINSASGTGGGGGGGDAGILGALLGAIPGASKYLSTNGSWVGGLANSAAQGYGVGESIGGAGSTNGDWGAVGGLIGDAASFIPGIGPILKAILPTAGGFLGGLFGNHPDPSKEPDVYDTQHYGQFVTDINGAPGTFNGQVINPEAQYSKANGKMGMGAQMTQWAQANPNDPLAKQILALGDNLGISNEKDGTFTLGSGKTISVTAYESLGEQWQAKVQNQQLAPIISISSYGGSGGVGGGYSSNSNPYNTPGLGSSDFASMEQGWINGPGAGATSNSSGIGTTSTPISGGSGGGGVATNYAAGTQGRLNVIVSTPVYLDGKLIANVVNAYNTQMQSRQGTLAA